MPRNEFLGFMTLRVSLGLAWGFLLQWFYGVYDDTASVVVWLLFGHGYMMLCLFLKGHEADTMMYKKKYFFKIPSGCFV